MMCAFMTPVLKSDWEVHSCKAGGKGGSNPTLTTSASELKRAQQLQRLQQIQQTRQKLLAGVGPRNQSLGARSQSFAIGQNRDAACPQRTCLSTNTSRNYLPISPLAAADKNKSKSKGSSSSINSFHNKLVDKMKTVLHIKDSKSGKKDDEKEEPDHKQQQQQTTDEQREQQQIAQQQVRPRRNSRPTASSRSSFEFPKIAEEVLDVNGTLVAA